MPPRGKEFLCSIEHILERERNWVSTNFASIFCVNAMCTSAEAFYLIYTWRILNNFFMNFCVLYKLFYSLLMYTFYYINQERILTISTTFLNFKIWSPMISFTEISQSYPKEYSYRFLYLYRKLCSFFCNHVEFMFLFQVWWKRDGCPPFEKQPVEKKLAQNGGRKR